MARRKRTQIHQHFNNTYVNRIPLVVFTALVFLIGALATTLVASRVTIHKLRAQSNSGWVVIEPSQSVPGSYIRPGPPQRQIKEDGWMQRSDKKSKDEGCVAIDNWHMVGRNGPVRDWYCP